MNSMISLLRDKRNTRNEEREKIETEQALYHRELLSDLEELKGYSSSFVYLSLSCGRLSTFETIGSRLPVPQFMRLFPGLDKLDCRGFGHFPTSVTHITGQRLECTEMIDKNLNILTAHRHTISKVVHESERCAGLPISNVGHRQALDFLSEAIDLVSDKDDPYRNERSAEKRVDACNLSANAHFCAEATAAVLKGLKSSTDKTETLMNNIHIITIKYDREDPGDLETSIFYE